MSAAFPPLPLPSQTNAPLQSPPPSPIWPPIPTPAGNMTATDQAALPLPAFRFDTPPHASAAPRPLPAPNDSDFTDADLFEALTPIFRETLHHSGSEPTSGIDELLEPMLRATIRRALAEYSPATRPFQGPGSVDRLVWHLQALFTSRTYEDVVFEKTHRFQVEEVFLVDVSSLALVSYASCDPARHGTPKRVTSTVHRLTMQLRHDDGSLRDTFELPDHRNALCCQGEHVILVAIVRGQLNQLLLADIKFSLKRIEDRFREKFQEPGSALLRTLQPFLEDCLLIQAPVSAA